jgi:hypothetical protein
MLLQPTLSYFVNPESGDMVYDNGYILKKYDQLILNKIPLDSYSDVKFVNFWLTRVFGHKILAISSITGNKKRSGVCLKLDEDKLAFIRGNKKNTTVGKPMF